jgi:hypothetical protein
MKPIKRACALVCQISYNSVRRCLCVYISFNSDSEKSVTYDYWEESSIDGSTLNMQFLVLVHIFGGFELTVYFDLLFRL